MNLPYASNRSAAVAGLWSGIGLSLPASWIAATGLQARFSENTLSVLVGVLFFLLPVLLLVIGRREGSIGVLWFLDPEQRKLQASVVKRMLLWFLCAGSMMAVASLVQSLTVKG